MAHTFDSLLAYWEARAVTHPDPAERARSSKEAKALRQAGSLLAPKPAQPEAR